MVGILLIEDKWVPKSNDNINWDINKFWFEFASQQLNKWIHFGYLSIKHSYNRHKKKQNKKHFNKVSLFLQNIYRFTMKILLHMVLTMFEREMNLE